MPPATRSARYSISSSDLREDDNNTRIKPVSRKRQHLKRDSPPEEPTQPNVPKPHLHKHLSTSQSTRKHNKRFTSQAQTPTAPSQDRIPSTYPPPQTAAPALLPAQTGRPQRQLGSKVTSSRCIPSLIYDIFAKGWTEHVPLSALTDEACDIEPMSSSSSSRESLEEDREISLTFVQWEQAWNRLLILINQYLPDEYPLWARHYEHISNQDMHLSSFETWLRYDITVRRRALHESFDPSVFQEVIYHDLRVKSLVEKARTLEAVNSNRDDMRQQNSSYGNKRFNPYQRR